MDNTGTYLLRGACWANEFVVLRDEVFYRLTNWTVTLT